MIIGQKHIEEKEYLTVAEFADAVGISKQAVYKQLNNQLKGRFKLVGKRKMIEKSATALFLKNEDNQNFNQLNNQLDEQLKEKDAQIAQLQKLLDQEQQLNLVANKRVMELENRTKLLEDQTKELEVEANKTWIQRLFGK